MTRKKWATLKWMTLRCSRSGFSDLGTPAVLGKLRTVESMLLAPISSPFGKSYCMVDAVIEGSVHASFRER